jgi:two-component system, chemotaxis family, protein-glutamate methylesterase/glutaminase
MMEKNLLRVLVVDDAVVYRRLVSDLLEELPGVEVVGTAGNGKMAMARMASLRPDLLILDLNMPEMDGLEVLLRMKTEAPDTAAIILSAFTPEGGELTMKALELGAFDYILKPQNLSMEENRHALKDALAPMIRSFVRLREVRDIIRTARYPQGTLKSIETLSGSTKRDQGIKTFTIKRVPKSRVVAIGISTGGPAALAKMMPALPGDLDVPVLIVQHMPPLYTQALAERLDTKCAIKVKEANDGEALLPNTAYIAPGGSQMKVAKAPGSRELIIRITNDPPENGCKPSADYLFRSIAEHFGGRATGVIMTGMGSDGASGLKLMKEHGATVIAQDASTSVVFGMARKPIEEEIVDVVVPLDKIAEEIRRTVK